MSTANPYLSVIIPCFNEDASIPLFYEEAIKILAQINEQIEFIFIDDGSTDNTLNILRQLAAQNNNVNYISFSRNFGKEAAMLAGLQRANGQFIATMDIDLQDPPSLIPQMLEAVASGEYDCAGTRRVNRIGEPIIRSFFARRFYSFMKKFSDIEIVDGARDFRLMNRKYLEAFLALQERNRFSKGIFPWLGFKTKWFEYTNIGRTTGETKWSFGKLLLYSFDGIIAFSSKPLAIASILGILLFLASFLLIMLIVIRKIMFGDPVDGWASTICIILFCSGVQLFTTGILGQYMAKIYTETKQRPQYIVQEEKQWI
ncbi:MAG: glycosyltransferase family 2 protein [Fibromonadales bacterium]|nr:glycosyltransferase family 2 protein [Fibromonadales bacterium]